MKNKNSLLKFGMMVTSVAIFGLSFSSATLFHLEINTGSKNADEIAVMKSEISTKIMPIHFADNGNDFGGFFYFSNGLTGTENNVDKTVEINGDDPYKCDNLVRGYYYNAERGERLWPLDKDTKDTRENLVADSQGDLSISGGIYTVCTTSGYNEALAACGISADNYDDCIDEVNATYKGDDHGYYGYLEHNYKGQKMVLIAGVDYDDGSKFVKIKSNSKFSPTFIRYLNQNPIGFIYDYNGGIGLVGCKFKTPLADSVKKTIRKIYNPGPADLTKIFRKDDKKIKVTSDYDAFIDCSDFNAIWSPVLSLIIEGIVGLSDEKKVGYIGNPEDDKMQYFSTANIDNNTLVNYAKKKAEILCRGKWSLGFNKQYNDKNSKVICMTQNVSATDSKNAKDKNKTLIVKGGNVEIKAENACSEPINTLGHNVLVIGGNLIIEENTTPCVFSKDGFLEGSKSSQDFTSAVTGSILNGQDYDLNTGAAVGSYLKGNFIIDGYITGKNNTELKNKYFIYGKLTSKDDFGTLLSTFSWRCNDGVATDDTYCPSSLYQSASLVIIDQNYDSPLLKN